ncbi:hypothetical protein L226DRAFT_131932 [Lentinus tigrinus ALCF2SS1-7]|nr:hypothetical protein L226DRAFT_131932 [Lentinus tigrinus ALCF2SS1-7]
MAQMPQFAQGSSSQTAADEIATAVAKALALQDSKRSAGSGSTPAGSDPRDEQTLIEALKKGYAQGLTTRQAIETLHNVNNHSQSSWKDFYLDHDKELYNKIHGLGLAITSSLNPHRDSVSQATGPSHVRQQLPRAKPLYLSSSPGKMRSDVRFRGTSPDSAPSGARSRNASEQSKSWTRSLPRSKDRDRGEAAKPSPMPQRSKRGDPVDEYHAETYIPPFSGSKKPKPPRRVSGDDGFKFTDDDKIFLIHYLRWRVLQANVPSKAEVFEELAKQTHHSADAWRRHWQQNAELPDRILAQGKKRYNMEHSATPSSDEEDAVMHEEDGREDEEEKESSDDEPSVEGTSRVAPTVVRQRRRGRVTAGFKVTDDDLHAMAKYKAERLKGWSDFPSKQGPWKEFSERPGNGKRTLNAWFCAARDHAAELADYVREYLREAESESNEEPTPPQQDDPQPSSPFGSRTPSQKTEHKVSTPRKRPAEPSSASEGVAQATKRIKQQQDKSNAKRKEEDVKEDEYEADVVEIA